VDLPEGEAVSQGDWQVVAPSSREPLAPHLEGAANAFRRRHRVYGPFALYGGRIDPGKGCEELLEYFQQFIQDGGDASLLLMGTKLMPLPEDPRVRFAGTLPDEERLHALEAATVVIVPSPYESLSLLALEAFAVGTPVLANARAEVLVEHCRRSHAGLYYSDRWEFTEALKLLMRDGALRAGMGANGKAYVNRHYRWTTILDKYERMFGRLRGQEPDTRVRETRERDAEPRRERPPHPDRGRERWPQRHRQGDRRRRGGRGARS
jgi:glycosyltransferase involved in cell wall biosynthesis